MAFQISVGKCKLFNNQYCHLEKLKFYSYNKINPRWPKDLKHKQAQEKKNSLTTLIILEIQIKTTFRYLLSTYQINRD